MTIIDIARLAGASIATVSRVINNRRVGEKTRKRVRKVIEEYEFYPNAFAQHLARKNNAQTEKNVSVYAKTQQRT